MVAPIRVDSCDSCGARIKIIRYDDFAKKNTLSNLTDLLILQNNWEMFAKNSLNSNFLFPIEVSR